MAIATVWTRRADTTRSWSSSGDGDGDANSTDISFETTTTKRVSSDAADTCRCQSNAADTNAPSQRSCYDCLNVVLQSGDECAINPYGKCVSAVTRFVKQVEDSYSFEAPGVGYFYLASNFSYCERTEVSCAKCRDEWINEYPTGYFGSQSDRMSRQGANNSSASLVCVGANGCLCLAYCELESYRASFQDTCAPVIAPPQSSFGYGNTSSSSSSNAVVWVQYFFALTAFLVILTPLVIAARKRIRSTNITTLDIFYTQPEHLRQEQRQEQQRQPRAPPLSLGGWRDDREKLKNAGDPSRFRSGASSDVATATAGDIVPTTSENQTSVQQTQQPSESGSAVILSRSEHLT